MGQHPAVSLQRVKHPGAAPGRTVCQQSPSNQFERAVSSSLPRYTFDFFLSSTRVCVCVCSHSEMKTLHSTWTQTRLRLKITASELKQETFALHPLQLTDASFDAWTGSPNPHQRRSRSSTSAARLCHPNPVESLKKKTKQNCRQMTTFYDENDLEEELRRVNCPDEDLEFDYLFEYEPPCNDFAGGGDQGLSGAFWQPSRLLSPVLVICYLKFNKRFVRCTHVNGKEKQEVNLTGFLTSNLTAMWENMSTWRSFSVQITTVCFIAWTSAFILNSSRWIYWCHVDLSQSVLGDVFIGILGKSSGCDIYDFQMCVNFTIFSPADDPNLASQKVLSPESEQAFPLEEASSYGIKSCSPSFTEHNTEVLSGYDNQEARNFLDGTRPAGLAVSPRIKITPSHEHYNHGQDSLQNHHLNNCPRPTLTVPGHDNLAYREPQCLSPASSNSSTSWHSESYSPWASPCVSPSSGQNTGDLCPRLQNIQTGSPRTSPGTSPRTSLTEDGCLGQRSPSPRPGSRSTSPQGKRTYDMYRNPGLVPGHRSRSPSPHSGHEDHNISAHYTHSSLADAMNGFGTGQPGLVPTKIVKTSSQVYTVYPENHGEGNYMVPCDHDIKTKPPVEPFFVIPTMWPKPLVPNICR